MIDDKLKVVFKASCNNFKKGVNKAIFSLLMFRIAVEKASMSNNKRRMTGKPMIRKRAYINACKNKQRKK